jgi:hypothetical protein
MIPESTQKVQLLRYRDTSNAFRRGPAADLRRGPGGPRSDHAFLGTWLIGDDPVAELHPDRHAEGGRRIGNLIGH